MATITTTTMTKSVGGDEFLLSGRPLGGADLGIQELRNLKRNDNSDNNDNNNNNDNDNDNQQ